MLVFEEYDPSEREKLVGHERSRLKHFQSSGDLIITSLEDPTTPPTKDYLTFLREPIIRLKRFPQQDFLRPLDQPFPFP